jgi:ABC-type multidrug transport system fused ATPase/permease subunit
LLQGTIKENLDPFGQKTEDEINSIVKDVHLKEKIASFPKGINEYCSESGSLFSMGERQLICLARAIIR